MHCPLPELERRERERGNRRVGEARTDYQVVHGFAEYDLEIDSMQPCQINVNTLVDAWESREPPSVFERNGGAKWNRMNRHLVSAASIW